MLFFTISPHNSTEDLFQLCGIEEYKAGKRVRLDSQPQLVISSPKIRKINESNKFEVKLDVTHFKPEDIKIKTVGNDLIVEGKHGERLDEHGFVSRQFTRRYELPKDIDLEQMSSSLSSEGKLMIEAPIKQTLSKERVIPITFVEKSEPSLQSQDKKSEPTPQSQDKVCDKASDAA